MSQPEDTRPSAARTHIGLVMESIRQQSRLPLTILARRTGSTPDHLTRVLAGEHFPSRRLTVLYARACGADPLVMLRIWDDERERRHRPATGTRHAPARAPAPDQPSHATSPCDPAKPAPRSPA
ncbi:helix-turn-helix transcriptional regulator [Streptomyces sp. NPDC051132]|uniref:helix-turn-helix domain-containing protein n=1 Tax=unclassified Streptomyces TaxID=2593676 RepID=UPI00342083DC